MSSGTDGSMVTVYNSIKDKLTRGDDTSLQHKCGEQIRFFRNCEKVIDNIEDEKRKSELKVATAVCLRYSTSFTSRKAAFLQFWKDVNTLGLDFYTALDRMELQLQLLMDNVSGYSGVGEIDDNQNIIRERKMRLKHMLASREYL